MTKRRSQVEVTRTLSTGKEIITINKNKMNKEMCEKVITKLLTEWESKEKDVPDIADMRFRCIER
jgi:hypothetical protein